MDGMPLPLLERGRKDRGPNSYSSPRRLMMFSPEQSVCGIRNLGNTCFLNAILQALASSPAAVQHLRQVTSCTSNDDVPLASAIFKCLDALAKPSSPPRNGSISPRSVLDAFREYLPADCLRDGEQNDSAEVLELLSIAKVSCGNVPFHGTTVNDMMCVKCRHNFTTQHAPFLLLPLALPITKVTNSRGRVELQRTMVARNSHLQQCLADFCSLELVHGVHCPRCTLRAALKTFKSKDSLPHLSVPANADAQLQKRDVIERLLQGTAPCPDMDYQQLATEAGLEWSPDGTACVKRISLGTAPKTLCLHLRRAVWTNAGHHLKLTGHVNFPVSLDVAPYRAANMLPLSSISQQYAALASPVQAKWAAPIASADSTPEDAPEHHKGDDAFMTGQDAATGHLSAPGPVQKLLASHALSLASSLTSESSLLNDHLLSSPNGTPSEHTLWFSISDEVVRQASLHDVLACQATLLFYER
ncbi:hypothetical protein WJX79_007677 [Trebouxia sp. C0005]